MKRSLLLACAYGLGAACAALPALAAPVEGFGDGIPLRYAVQQIVPHGYVVTYSGVDRDQPISWRGGGDWQATLRGISSHGKHLGVAVSGTTVVISDADAAYSGPTPAVRAPAYVPAAATSAFTAGADYGAPRAQETRGLVILPMHEAAPPPPAEPMTVASMAPPPQPTAAPVVVAEPMTSAKTFPTTPVPVAASGPMAAPTPVAAAPVAPAPVIVPTPAPAVVEEPPVVTTAPAAEPQPRMTARQRRAAAAAVRAAEGGGPSPRSIPVRVSEAVVSPDGRTWHAAENATLDQVLGDWADKAGWTLVYQTRMIYDLQASADFDGDFIGAASSLIRSVRAAPQPVATFYRGNKTVVVTNPADQTN